MSLEKIEFFGAVDRKGKVEGGKRSSEYPAWYLESHINELQEDINYCKNTIDNHLVPENEMPKLRARKKELEDRMLAIINSKPKLSARDKDMLNGVYESLTSQVGDSMFTYTEMQKGLVSAHEEARRMTQPCISIDENCAEILPKFGINHVKGKISRNQASRVAKVLGRLLEKRTNLEYFRKDHAYGTYKSTKSLAELEMEAGV